MSSPAEAAVHTVGLSKVYKDFYGRDKVRALNSLDLTIRRGEVFGLLGPNGSGKSTTIKLLLGLIFPTAGSAHVLGYPAGDTRVNERVGFLPEESYLYRFLNGEETLRFYGKLFKIPRRDLKLVDLTSEGLHRLKVPKGELIASPARDYVDTARWAQVLHHQFPDVDGLLWMSRQRDRDHALLLFGDRLGGVLSGSRVGGPLARNPALRDVVLQAALRAGIEAD